MGLFDLFAGPDMNVGVQEWKASKGGGAARREEC